MASLIDLSALVAKATPVEDYSTFQYHVQLQYGETKWEVTKRFSDFDKLLQNLASNKYAGLPKLSGKTLLGSPTDQAAIEARKAQLQTLLHDLLFRPDTRTSQPLRQFLAIDSHTGAAIRSLQPDAMRSLEDPRFGVSDMCVVPHANIMLVTHEDSTQLSRLGRVWSVVEADELGALHLWTRTKDGSWKRAYSGTYGIKVRSLCWEEASKQFFVGLEDGKIEAYVVALDSLKPTLKATLELHHKSPVTHLSASPRRLLSLGFDTAMRIVDVGNHELLCGGRLMKRLRKESDYLSSGLLDDPGGRAFIGTSGGDVFILDVSKNPPDFLHTLELNSKPVSSLCAVESRLLIAHGDRISVMSFEEKGQERRSTRLAVYRSRHMRESDVSILSMAMAPERKLLFGGYSDGSVAVWSTREGEALIVFRAHPGNCTGVAWVEDEKWGTALLTAGDDGKVTTWNLGGTDEDFVLWRPEGSAADDPALTAFEPTWGTPAVADMEVPTLIEAEPPLLIAEDDRPLQQAMVSGHGSSGLGEDDDDLDSAFRLQGVAAE
eukprot:CAMPEP_0172801962 /NCGR_PEP_ID=MMETSP1075-20121228/3570_1 /TAXON_ID=2916 /ORGANISM="Ceratium fusus, Strain PA161109" /LENGTH=547 /DNA_ID=CAMNT_0013640149 /DNA_START=109 /DNA_END=1750 /DNA_ORIENTATION=-